MPSARTILSWLLVRGSWLMAPGSWLLVRGSWFMVPGWLLVVGLVAGSAASAAEPARAQPACEFRHGFKLLRDLIPTRVGQCREEEWHNSFNGDGLQQTTGGLLVWRKADNWTAFTDGNRTWINGPGGLAVRLNSGPLFPWEAAPTATAPAPEEALPPSTASTLTHGPLLGAVTDNSVRVWSRADGSGLLEVEVKRADRSWPGVVFGPAQLANNRDFTAVVEVTRLRASTTYDYRLLLDGAVQDDFGGTFRTLPEAGKPGAFRFSIGGDLSYSFAPFTILDRVLDQRPDFNLLLGDLIYADQPQPIPPLSEAYALKYRANWSEPSFRNLTRRVPSFMMWDDHEIANDYDGGKAGPYAAARAAFDSFVASHNPPPLLGDELFFSFKVADVEFFVLDTRSFRSPSARPDDGAKTMLGADQKLHLKNWLATSRAPFKLVVTSVPFHDFGTDRPDIWSRYATERAELFEFIRQRRISGVVALSGDQHWTSLVRHDPFGIWEFNSTPLAQVVNAHPPTNDPRLVLAYDASPAFGLIEVNTRPPGPRMTFVVVDAAGQRRNALSIAPGVPQ